MITKTPKTKLNSGSEIPILGLGTWLLNKDPIETILKAIDLGYTLIDTSSDYGTQPAIGQALKRGKVHRDQVYITTKVEEDDDAYKRVLSNLKELGLDWMDLVLIHRPPSYGVGIDLWEGLIKAKKEGLLKDIGVSSYTKVLIEELVQATDEIPVVNQLEWTPFGYSQDLKDYLTDKHIIIQSYSPLTHGKRLDDSRLQNLAYKYEKTPAQILIRWNVQQGFIPLPKANKEKHLKENLEIFDFELEEGDIKLLNSLNEEYSSLGELTYI